MKIIKRQSKQTYKGKDGKDHHYYNYFIQLENGKRVQIKTSFTDDLKTLDAVAVYER